MCLFTTPGEIFREVIVRRSVQSFFPKSQDAWTMHDNRESQTGSHQF